MSSSIILQARQLVIDKNYNDAELLYHNILYSDGNNENKLSNDYSIQEKEESILDLGHLYKLTSNSEKLHSLILKSTEVLSIIAKSKISKIIRQLIDLFNFIPDSIDTQILSLKEAISWASKEKRSFLTQSLQLKLAQLYYKKFYFNDALNLTNSLSSHLRKLDDKNTLIEVQLLQSKIYYNLKNFSKSKASLTSARTSANSIYCSSKLQADLDCMSGILHCQDNDFETAFSYFYEAFENLNSLNWSKESESQIIKILKYILLTKIMLNKNDDIIQILSNKLITSSKSIQNNLKQFDAIKKISIAYNQKSLENFQKILNDNSNEFSNDYLIKSNFKTLYHQLLEQNLLKIIKPYSCIEISYISRLIKLDETFIESKLSQMILDNVFYGVLDQGNGWLYIYDENKIDKNYGSALQLIKEMSKSVNLLYEKATVLN
ncbi:proteasome regulatory particle lid subunit RPN6 [Ascoidea rubescens DSM 1968]|uniref:Essential, non-ATPase regulatory subunit of the 26S proteasome lid n=1 Tax=Ascoidea rubescens DSM 1968 TaxID=1344418 RepID=A0A1D2VDQ1_9ASCO|nr:Essential, non-ATPase regulatory subunit of the 26S proteasome lid [Ascoidea rubescens DSM 1968]ODV59729.1 Essential, non-ATPase regulatory subunit of the 26S proteasome lid [Ascoidea rubescens DSM 1968]